ncbi:DUF642 domain-containing protein [Kitasatospora sp. NPDC058201]|uniref:DUF642 domain-containing protein n=1 Tax=unclassified Kitasatospora TaxID=2633591 RepID=UPI00364649AC
MHPPSPSGARAVSRTAAVTTAGLLLTATAGTAAAAPAAPPAAGAAATAVAAVAFSDGGFESPVVPAPAPFTDYLGGQTFGPWTVGGDSADLTSDRLWDVAEGHQSLDLNGSTTGSVSQTFPVAPLTTYLVTFKLAGNPVWAPALKTGQVRVNGTTVLDFAFDVSGHGLRSMGYVEQTTAFTNLLGTSATLTFASTTPGYGGPVIDDVKVRSCLLVLCLP